MQRAASPRAVGVVGDEVLSAWADWETVELRTESGALRQRASPMREHGFRIHDARFVGGRHLVCGVGTGVMSHGLWALDVVTDAWAPPLSERWSDVGVLAGCGATPSVLFADGADVVRWDLEERREVARAHAPEAYAAAFAPDGRGFALAGPTGLVRLDGDGSPRRRVAWRGAGPTAMAFVDEGALLTAGFDGELRLHDAESLAPRREGRVAAREVTTIAASPDGGRVACCADGVTHVLDARTLEPVGPPEDGVAAAFTERGCVVLGRGGTRWL